SRFERVSFEWIPRERNKAADALANRAMDEAQGKPVSTAPIEDLDKPAAASWSPPSSLEDATRFILVRHGETALTKQGRYSGRGDVPLSDEGQAQAMAAGGRVAGISRDVTAVLSSPLSRCVRTAELIAAEVGGIPVTVVDDLVECDFGEWEGLTFAEA